MKHAVRAVPICPSCSLPAACEKAIRKLRRAIVVLPNDQSLKLELAGTIRLEAYLRNRALGSSSHDQNIGRPGNPEPDEPEPARSPK